MRADRSTPRQDSAAVAAVAAVAADAEAGNRAHRSPTVPWRWHFGALRLAQAANPPPQAQPTDSGAKAAAAVVSAVVAGVIAAVVAALVAEPCLASLLSLG